MPEYTWIWGRRAVLEALTAGRVRRLFIRQGVSADRSIRSIESAAQSAGIAVEQIDAAAMPKVARDQSTQGVLAQIEPQPKRHLTDILEACRRSSRAPFLLVLDQIQDPQNLGNLLRTAEAAGVHGVILPQRHSASVTGVVSKSSAGAVHHLQIAAVPNLSHALRQIKDSGLWLVGLDPGVRTSVFSIDLTVPLAIVIGSEGSGMRRLTRDLVDLPVRIPMHGNVASLNASAAGAVALFEVVRQRDPRW